jgi:hypothetical protein
MKRDVNVSCAANGGFEAPEGVDTFFRGDVYVIDTNVHRYTFIVSDPVATSGTLVGGDLEDACVAMLLGSVARDTSDFSLRALRLGMLAVFSVTDDVGRRPYRTSEVTRLRRVMRSGIAPG